MKLITYLLIACLLFSCKAQEIGYRVHGTYEGVHYGLFVLTNNSIKAIRVDNYPYRVHAFAIYHGDSVVYQSRKRKIMLVMRLGSDGQFDSTVEEHFKNYKGESKRYKF